MGNGSIITPSGPIIVVILVGNRDYKRELTIHSLYVHPFCVKEVYNTSFIVNLMQIMQLVLKDDLGIYSISDQLTSTQK